MFLLKTFINHILPLITVIYLISVESFWLLCESKVELPEIPQRPSISELHKSLSQVSKTEIIKANASQKDNKINKQKDSKMK